MPRVEEWDYPPPRRFQAEQIDLEAREVGSSSPRQRRWHLPSANRAVDQAGKAAFTLLKVVVAVPLTALAIGAVWLIVTVLKT